MDPKIMVLAKVENLLDKEGNVIGRLVADKADNRLKVKKGKGGKLENRWEELIVDKAYSFTMALFRNKDGEDFPYVADFQKVEDAFVIEAQKKVEDKQIDGRTKSMALSYAKDLLIADKVPLDKVLSYAEVFYRYMQGDIEVKDEAVFKEILGKFFHIKGGFTEGVTSDEMVGK